MRIYISTPITGRDLDKQRGKAAEIAKRIAAAGHTPVNPFDTPAPPAYFNERQQYAYYMGMDIAELLRCDAAYFARGWDKSKGCMLEHAAAQIYGLNIYHSINAIPKSIATTNSIKSQNPN